MTAGRWTVLDWEQGEQGWPAGLGLVSFLCCTRRAGKARTQCKNPGLGSNNCLLRWSFGRYAKRAASPVMKWRFAAAARSWLFARDATDGGAPNSTFVAGIAKPRHGYKAASGLAETIAVSPDDAPQTLAQRPQVSSSEISHQAARKTGSNRKGFVGKALPETNGFRVQRRKPFRQLRSEQR